MVSMFNFYRMNATLGRFTGTGDEFFNLFMAGRTSLGSWFDYTSKFWSLRDNRNFLMLTFEDMKKDVHSVVHKVAKFIGKPINDSQVRKVAEIVSFKGMKQQFDSVLEKVPSFDQKISPFLRKGELGDWKNYFTVAQNETFDKVYDERMGECGLTFTYE